MPDEWPHEQPCPHGFHVGTIARARRSLEEWPDRNERAVCIFCHELVDLGALLSMRRPESARHSSGD